MVYTTLHACRSGANGCRMSAIVTAPSTPPTANTWAAGEASVAAGAHAQQRSGNGLCLANK